jgi:hypothetical protein
MANYSLYELEETAYFPRDKDYFIVRHIIHYEILV